MGCYREKWLEMRGLGNFEVGVGGEVTCPSPLRVVSDNTITTPGV